MKTTDNSVTISLELFDYFSKLHLASCEMQSELRSDMFTSERFAAVLVKIIKASDRVSEYTEGRVH